MRQAVLPPSPGGETEAGVICSTPHHAGVVVELGLGLSCAD